ncbi:MAG TPA: hypothetical protein VGP22_12360, partial [Albitalea sp.]|nr:hypothetical protein [Albitalea sp.]
MSASTLAAAAGWHGDGLTALVEALRARGFRAGPAETVSAGRLLMRLGQRPRAPKRLSELRAWLRPVFCSNREEQQHFDTIFDEWAQQLEQRRAPPPINDPLPDAAPPADPAPSRWRRWLPAVLVALIVLAVFAVQFARRPAPQAVVPPDRAASQPAAVSSAPAVRPAASAPGIAPQQADLQGFYPALRNGRSLRPAVVWGLLALPLLLLLLMSGLPGLSLMSGRQRSARQVVLDTRRLADEARQVLPALTLDVAGRLERHLRGDSKEGAPLARRRRLDARRTVEATLRNHGILSPRYRAAPLRPSYLMLIDAKDEHDPRGRLFYLWALRLQREGLM